MPTLAHDETMSPTGEYLCGIFDPALDDDTIARIGLYIDEL